MDRRHIEARIPQTDIFLSEFPPLFSREAFFLFLKA
jgi:hypothetical protein